MLAAYSTVNVMPQGACLFIPCFFLVGIVGTVFWVWMIIDCAVNEPNEGNNKIVWIIVILVGHWIGALIYFIVRRPRRLEEIGR